MHRVMAVSLGLVILLPACDEAETPVPKGAQGIPGAVPSLPVPAGDEPAVDVAPVVDVISEPDWFPEPDIAPDHGAGPGPDAIDLWDADTHPCPPACGDKECGPDGCGGSCGECQPGEACHGGDCVPGPDGDSCEGYCGAQAPAGCYCDESCLDYGDCCPDPCVECPELRYLAWRQETRMEVLTHRVDLRRGRLQGSGLRPDLPREGVRG